MGRFFETRCTLPHKIR